MKRLLQTALISTALISGAAMAEVSQECILDGRVSHKESTQDATKVRLTFNSIEHGEQARCRSMGRSAKARIQFKAKASDNLDKLPHGSEVRYRYVEQDGQAQWELLQANTSI
jgi:hypothetical protein